MLHGMIPIAFFSALLRRFLDHLHETPEYVAESSTLTYFGTSAIVASAGIGFYRLFHSSKKNPDVQTLAEPEQIEPLPAPIAPKRRRSRSRRKGGIRKRYRKGKNWLLDHVKRYSKYADHVGNLIHGMFKEKPEILPENPEDNFVSSQLNQNSDTDIQGDVVVDEIPTDVDINERKFFDDDSEMTENTTDAGMNLEKLLKQEYKKQKRAESSIREIESCRSSSTRTPRKRSKSSSRARYGRSDTPIRYLSKKNNDLWLAGEKKSNSRQLHKRTRSGRSYDRADH